MNRLVNLFKMTVATVVLLICGCHPPDAPALDPSSSLATGGSANSSLMASPWSRGPSTSSIPPQEVVAPEPEGTCCRKHTSVNSSESPDPKVRLQALEDWAKHPTANIDPLTYALVDPDETVRERAQQLWELELAR